MFSTKPGISSVRTMSVSLSTPYATMNASWIMNINGMTTSAENVAASTVPADVMAPPVTVSALRIPGRVPM